MAEYGGFPEFLRSVTAAQLEQLTAQAATAPRKRAHLLLHTGHDDLVQRLLIAAEPGTYVRPHQHSQQWEMLTVQRGSLDVLIFSDDGAIVSRTTLDRTSPIVQIPMAHWHGCVVRAPETLIIEIKPGPYRTNEVAGWAPEEGHEDTDELVRWAATAATGQKWRSSARSTTGL